MQPDILPKIRAKQEAALLELKAKLEETQNKEKERKYAQRYHHVRFFERVKLERLLKKAENMQSQQSLAEKLKDDLLYVMHFPKGEKYVSILKSCDNPEAQAALDAERHRLKVIVRKRMAEEALIAEADEGRSLLAAESKLGDLEQKYQETGEADEFFLQNEAVKDAKSKETLGSRCNVQKEESSSEEDVENNESFIIKSSMAPQLHCNHVEKKLLRSGQDRAKAPKQNGLKSKHKQTKQKPLEKTPVRTRSEGGRKRKKR